MYRTVYRAKETSEVRGHTRKRGGTWSFVIELGRDETGRRKQQWVAGFRTQKEANHAMTETLAKVQTGAYVPPTRETLGGYLNDWLTAVRPSIRESTWRSYELNVRVHLIPAIGNIRLQDLTASRINAFYGGLIENGWSRSGNKGGLNPRTVKYIGMILKRALSAAVKENRIPRNPADAATPPRIRQNAEMRTWSAAELRTFLDHVRDDRLYAAYHVAAMTGLRRGELLGLHWRDVDLDAGRLAVRETLLAVQDKLTWSQPKTGKSRRSVALDRETAEALRAHRRRQLEERLAWGGAYTDNDLVFARENGDPIHPNRFSEWFDHHIAATGIPRIRLHDLRHTHATLALAAGVNPKVVSERLGHATISITLDTYSHVIPAMAEDAAEKIARAVFG
jgi:integrase